MTEEKKGGDRGELRAGSLPLPDTSKWGPRDEKQHVLSSVFELQCASVERSIQSRARQEQSFNIDNYDSGLGVEDIVREELERLLPGRYAVRNGVLSDRLGRTAGDFDAIIFNGTWFPAVKTGATPKSRRFHFPIDGAYGVLEVKQRLTASSLDDAMEKLVCAHRLHRPRTFIERVTENREGAPCNHGLTNPLFSIVLAADLGPDTSLEELADRFVAINRTLKRLEVVRALCILGHGTLTWGYFDDKKEVRPALFMRDDLYSHIIPTLCRTATSGPALFQLMVVLLTHLYHSILAPEDIAAAYGSSINRVSVPVDPDQTSLPPDSEWVQHLAELCQFGHEPMGETAIK